ncbi:MAG: hypothetical protein Q9225_007211 [Loekoesia sp. 1 TL-2023]
MYSPKDHTSMSGPSEQFPKSQLFVSSPRLSWNETSQALLRKYADVSLDPKSKSLRRRIESHTTTAIQNSVTRPLQPSQQAINDGMFLCEQVNKAFDGQPLMPEIPLWQASSTSDRCMKNLPRLLLNLYWRTRKQMAIFEVFVMLYQHEHFSAEALSTAVDYFHTSDNVRNVMKMLHCFEKIADLAEPPSTRTEWQLDYFEHGSHWLAVMICRCCHDIEEVNEVISLIAYSERLGRLNASAVDQVNEEHAMDVQTAEAASRNSQGHGKGKGKQKQVEPTPFFVMNETENAAPKASTEIFGLILPSGQGSDIRQLFDDANNKFLRVEKVFMDFFGVTEEVLAMDHEGYVSGGTTGS